MTGFTDRNPDAYRADWRTPTEVIGVVRRAFLGAIDLDPCAADSPEHWFAHENRSIVHNGDDGLTSHWYGRVFVNPPYNANAEWVAKCIAERERCSIILLIPSRTDTRYWQEGVSTADAVCFWRGRLKFSGCKDPAKFPVAFVYWGQRPEVFADAFRAHGLIYSKRREAA